LGTTRSTGLAAGPPTFTYFRFYALTETSDLLIPGFIRQEAVYSSRIEGTQATLGELLAAEAGAAVERSPDDLREVGNYVLAL
jgi:Fic family protein